MTIVLNGTTGITNDGGYTGDGVVFADTTPANTLVTTTGGNVGIGTATPQAALSIKGAYAGSPTGGDGIHMGASGGYAAVEMSGTLGAVIDFNKGDGSDQSGRILYDHTSNNMLFNTNSITRARIDSTGILLVNSDGTLYGNEKFSVKGGTANATAVMAASSTTGIGQLIFLNSSNGLAGYIQFSGSTTSYVTSSDYRLKDDIQPMTGALARVAQLKPVTYKWKADGTDGQGFIAHELQAVVPDCVVGEKDEVTAEGKPQYQGIDTSFLVATLTAAIQEQQAIITALTARVEALEGTQP
jgi:hypothetical protein